MEPCKGCGLVAVVPMPNETEIKTLYHEDFDHFAPYLDQIDVHRKYFQKKLREIVGKKILDIGCAMGVFLEEAQKEGREAYGVDISKDAVIYCKKKGLRVSQTYPRMSFDAVTAFEVIEHERNPLGMMKRVYTLLKKGGVAVLTTPNHDSIWRKIMGKSWVGYKHPEHVTFWNPRSLRVLMEKTGFKKIKIQKDTLRPFPLSFLFTRAADYFPWAAWLFKPIGKILQHFNIVNPINPWDDLIVVGRK